MRTLCSSSNREKTEPKVLKEISERWRRKCHGLEDVFCCRCWASYTDTWQSACKCLSEPPSATCSSFPASISQSASNIYAGQWPCHTAKRVKMLKSQLLETQLLESRQGPGLQSTSLQFWNLYTGLQLGFIQTLKLLCLCTRPCMAWHLIIYQSI